MKRLAVLAVLVGTVSPARAQDRFEIQVYDSTIAPPLGYGMETHVNHVFADVAETHVTFEPHLGVSSWLELGGYFQTAVRADGTFDYAGVKLRAKLRLPGAWDGHIGLAVNTEISAVPERYEENVWGSEVRPIIDLTLGRFYASLNPIVTMTLRGDLAGHPALEPAAKVAVVLGSGVAVGVEAYAAVGPVDDLGSEDFFRVLAAVDWTSPWVDLNFGVGPAWGTADDWVGKLIIGVHPPEAAASAR